MKKNLFTLDLNNSSEVSGSHSSQETCEPCSSECNKIKSRINNRKLSDIKSEEILNTLTPFNNK